MTIKDINEGLNKKDFSALELTKIYLEEIEKRDKDISAFLTITTEQAMAQAKRVDEMISKDGEIPLLAGVPLAVKDNILVKGIKCTASSKILENYVAPYDATCIKKLREQHCIILGKTNLDEFAMGSSTENSAFGPTRNPHDLERVPGGSSGGSAAAVAANFCSFALGSDTGGSIRQPSSFCGVVGLKPTYGAVSRYGLIAFASSLDQIGPITKSVEDAEIVFNAIRGYDERDSTSVKQKALNEHYQEKAQSPIQVANLRIGVPKEYFIKGMDKELEKVVRAAIKKYEEMGAKIEEVSLSHTEYALACYYIIASSEASANLARYDGIKYGYSVARDQKDEAQNLFDVYLRTRAYGFGPEVRRRIMLGTYALSAGYYDAYYLRAQKVRAKIKQDFDNAFERVDVIFTPVTPTPAFKLGEKIKDPLTMYLSDVLTVSVNLAGLPAVAFPVGKVGELPVGLQIIGKYFEENKILNVAKLLQQNIS